MPIDQWMESHRSSFMMATEPSFASSNSTLILEVYKQLNKAIDEMDYKVEHVIKKHQSEFLFAYRNHIAKIKKELAEIKHKSEEQQKMFSSNERIQYLQKEMIIFREEALKLYNKLDQKTQENQIHKIKIKDLEKIVFQKERESKEYLRVTKIQQLNKHQIQNKIQELEHHLKDKDISISKLNSQINKLLKNNQYSNHNQEKKERESNQKIKQSLRTSREHPTTRFSSMKMTMSSKMHGDNIYDSQLKEWFLECVKVIKREIALRNNSNSFHEVLAVNSITEFKAIDKLKLLELFIQNQKLLTWMYERIFPDRLSQLRRKLSAHRVEENSSPYQEQIENQEVVDYVKAEKDLKTAMLPKVLDKGNRYSNSQIRNKVVIRNGKLNLSYAS